MDEFRFSSTQELGLHCARVIFGTDFTSGAFYPQCSTIALLLSGCSLGATWTHLGPLSPALGPSTRRRAFRNCCSALMKLIGTCSEGRTLKTPSGTVS